ncbi:MULTISPECIES: hypothetical protein [Microbacterium]|uniref:hypothetical protein n=1 Tax=Microbacterium TaxID=33882 RepID=UPI0016502ADB|nr:MULTISPECIES: hypothetical protein [Microbacterium]MCK6066139.1 hypothetical protein [Microbacterium sp. EYE_512]
MFTHIPALVNDDAALRRRGRFVTTAFLAAAGDEHYLFSVHSGELTVRPGPFVSPRWSFALRAESDSWQRFWSPAPDPGWHDLMAMIKFKTLVAEGDLHPFMSNLLWFKDVLAAPRRLALASEASR